MQPVTDGGEAKLRLKSATQARAQTISCLA